MNTTSLSKEEKQVYWSGHIEKWRQSGLSRSAYCKQEDVSVCQLGYWINKEKSGPEKLSTEQSGFIKLRTLTDQCAGMDYAFQLWISDTILLQWRGEASPGYIHQLVKAFGA